MAEGAVVRLGRDDECELSFDATKFPKVSGLHAQFEATTGGLIVRPLSRSNATLLNGKPIERPTPVRRGDVVRLGYTGPEIGLSEVVSLSDAARTSPSPPASEPISNNHTTRWIAIGGAVVTLVALIAFLMKPGTQKTNASSNDANNEVAKKPVEPDKPTPTGPSERERFKDAVVSVGVEVDGVFRIVGSGLLITPDQVATTATIAQFVNDSIKEAAKHKKALGDKAMKPAIRHANGQVRLRDFVVDPKFDRLREIETLSHNLAIGRLERPLVKLAYWRDDDDMKASLVAKPNDKPEAVDCIAWEGQGENVFSHNRKEWNGVKVTGGDPGSSGEFVAFHVEESLPGSSAGGPVWRDGKWRGLLVRHSALGDPTKKIWKFVPTTHLGVVLALGGND